MDTSLFLFTLKFLGLIVPVLVSVAFITLLERKILGLIGLRFGPNKVSMTGILQPISDALKLSGKQVNNLSNKSFLFYYFSAGLMLFSSLVVWTALNAQPPIFSWKLAIVLILICLSFNSLNSILAGWSTFSKYSLIGSLRTVSQLISYEAVLYMVLFIFMYLFLGFSNSYWQFHNSLLISTICPLAFLIWLPSCLAELNRTPYDFSEGESELVSGFNTEFGSSAFTLIFLAEYSNIIFMSMITGVLFFHLYIPIGFLFMMLFTIWIRSVLPRFRFDKLMILAWKFLIPFSTMIFLCMMLWIF